MDKRSASTLLMAAPSGCPPQANMRAVVLTRLCRLASVTIWRNEMPLMITRVCVISQANSKTTHHSNVGASTNPISKSRFKMYPASVTHPIGQRFVKRGRASEAPKAPAALTANSKPIRPSLSARPKPFTASLVGPSRHRL